MEDTKPLWMSKLNWAGLFAFVVGLLAYVNVIPAESEAAVLEAVMMLFGILVPVVRTFFTTRKLA
jgi:hypothetical protein